LKNPTVKLVGCVQNHLGLQEKEDVKRTPGGAGARQPGGAKDIPASRRDCCDHTKSRLKKGRGPRTPRSKKRKAGEVTLGEGFGRKGKVGRPLGADNGPKQRGHRRIVSPK